MGITNCGTQIGFGQLHPQIKSFPIISLELLEKEFSSL